jgi:hypothetical protein
MNLIEFRKKVWGTTLGVRAKLTLLAIAEISEIQEDATIAPPDIFLRLIPMIGRDLSSVVQSIQRLESQGILKILPISTGYSFEFHPENEIRHAGKNKRGQR